MRRWLRWIVAVPAALAAMALAVSNRERVTVSFDPLPLEFTLPLYGLALGSLAIGVVLGGVGVWWAGRGRRRQARRDRRALRALSEELAALKARAPSTGGNLPANVDDAA
jgi:uncharacterized integral membrane protein